MTSIGTQPAAFCAPVDDRAPRIRVHRLRIPTQRNNLFFLFIIAVGFVVSWLIAFCLLALIALVVHGDSQTPPPQWVAGACWIVSAAGPVLWVWWFARFRHRRLLRRSILRTERLARLVKHPDVFERLPHRVLENLLRSPYFRPRRLVRLLHTVPRRQVFMIEEVANAHWLRPPAGDLLFEPVDVSEDSERVVWLLDAILQQGLGEKYTDEGDLEDSNGALYSEVPMIKRLGWYMVTVIGALFCVQALYNLWRSRDPWIAGIIAGTVLFFVLLRLAFESLWWLVPGGLIYREVRAWRRGVKVRLLTPDDTPLVMDMRTGVGTVLDAGRRRSFRCAEWARWLVVAGWISRARRPTDDEIRGFLDATST